MANAKNTTQRASDHPAATSALNEATSAPERKGLSQEYLDKSAAFERAYSRWYRARAALNDPDAPEDTGDARDKEYALAERELGFMPAISEQTVLYKMELLSLSIEDNLHQGERSDRFTPFPVAAIRNDLMRLGVSDVKRI